MIKMIEDEHAPRCATEHKAALFERERERQYSSATKNDCDEVNEKGCTPQTVTLEGKQTKTHRMNLLEKTAN